MDRLAVYGWDDRAMPMLQALRQDASFRVVAVGDRRAAALVRARSATGSPCYQHSLEMLRHAEFDAAFLAVPEGAAQAARAAADAGAALLLLGDQADGETLAGTIEAGLRGRVPVVVLRPRLQRAGLAFLLELAASDSGWRPRFLDLSVTGGDEAMPMARDAIALAGRLMDGQAASVVGWGLGTAGAPSPAVVTAELRYADSRIASLRARTGAEEGVRLEAECALGELRLDSAGDETTLTMRMRDGRRETTRLTDRNPSTQEALRAARLLAARTTDQAVGDLLCAPRVAAALIALEQAMETGQVVAVQERSSRANLVLMAGKGRPSGRRRGQLHLVGV